MTELLALLQQTDLVTLNVLTSWLILLLSILQALLERPGLLTVDGLTSLLTLLTLQTLRPVALEQTVLLTFNGLMSLLTLLELQTLQLLTLLEHRGLLTFNGFVTAYLSGYTGRICLRSNVYFQQMKLLQIKKVTYI